MGSIGAPELLIILILVLLVFGGAKLPKLARSLGQAQREFKTGLTDSAAEASKSGQPADGDNNRSGTPGKNGAA